MASMSKRAERDLAELTESLRAKAEVLIGRLDMEPALGKKLLGALAGKRSAWLGRTHRIIYTLSVTNEAHVLAIPQRRDAYR